MRRFGHVFVCILVLTVLAPAVLQSQTTFGTTAATVRADVPLEVGEVTAEVTVTGGAPRGPKTKICSCSGRT